MNGLSNLDETFSEYSLTPSDDLIRFRRSTVKVTAGRRGGKAKASTSTLVEVHVLVRFELMYFGTGIIAIAPLSDGWLYRLWNDLLYCNNYHN